MNESRIALLIYLSVLFVIIFIIGYYKFARKIFLPRKMLLIKMQTEIERAVTEYENTFSQNSGQSSNTFQLWKDKYKYISDFISFPYWSLRIGKEYKNTIKKYFNYFTKTELQN